MTWNTRLLAVGLGLIGLGSSSLEAFVYNGGDNTINTTTSPCVTANSKFTKFFVDPKTGAAFMADTVSTESSSDGQLVMSATYSNNVMTLTNVFSPTPAMNGPVWDMINFGGRPLLTFKNDVENIYWAGPSNSAVQPLKVTGIVDGDASSCANLQKLGYLGTDPATGNPRFGVVAVGNGSALTAGNIHSLDVSTDNRLYWFTANKDDNGIITDLGTFTQANCAYGCSNADGLWYPCSLQNNSSLGVTVGLDGIIFQNNARPVDAVQSFTWDSRLRRGYIGFRRDSTTALGAASVGAEVFVAMARFDTVGALSNTADPTPILVIEPMITDLSVINSVTFGAAVTTNTCLTSTLASSTAVTRFCANHLRTLWTSSNNDPHLVAQIQYANEAGVDANHTIICIPLVKTNAATTALAPNSVGRAAQKGTVFASLTATDPSPTAQTSSHIYARTDIQAVVGGGPLPVNNVDNATPIGATTAAGGTFLSANEITNVEVIGDTVFASVKSAGAADQYAHTVGIYASNALFDENGLIAGWTPWRKVTSALGAAAATHGAFGIQGFGLDITNQRVVFDFNSANTLTTPAFNGVGTTSWNQGNGGYNDFSLSKFLTKLSIDIANPSMLVHMPAILNAGLGNSDLSVISDGQSVSICSFSGLLDTYAYNYDGGAIPDATNTLTNTGKISLLQRPFASISQPVALFDVQGLSAGITNVYPTLAMAKHYQNFTTTGIARVYCTEISRSANNIAGAAAPAFPRVHGYLFAGGLGGISVLSSTTAGSIGYGWDATAGDNTTVTTTAGNSLQDFSAAHFANTVPVSSMSFAKIPDGGIMNDESVHAMVSTGNFLYVMTQQGIYRLRLHSNNLSGAMLAADVNTAPTMFNSNLNSVYDATTVGDLSAIVAGDNVPTSDTTTAGSTRFNKNVLVWQKVFTNNSTQHVVDMVGIPNTNIIFVAMINNDGTSSIYALGNSNGSTLNADTSRVSELTYVFSQTATPTAPPAPITIAGRVRKLEVVAAHTLNSTLTSTNSVLANLYVVTGDYSNPVSGIYRFAIKGSFTPASIASTNLYPAMSLNTTNATSWNAAIPTNGATDGSYLLASNVGFLGDNVSVKGLPYLIAQGTQPLSQIASTNPSNQFNNSQILATPAINNVSINNTVSVGGNILAHSNVYFVGGTPLIATHAGTAVQE